MTLTSTVVAVTKAKSIVQGPSTQQLQKADSVHVLAFSSQGDLIVAESEGDFDIDIWERVFEEGKRRCRGNEGGGDDSDEMGTDTEGKGGLEGVLMDVVGKKVTKDQKWKEGLSGKLV